MSLKNKKEEKSKENKKYLYFCHFRKVQIYGVFSRRIDGPDPRDNFRFRSCLLFVDPNEHQQRF